MEWKKHAVADGDHHHLILGPLDIWLAVEKDEWRVTSDNSADETREADLVKEGGSDELDWERWSVGDGKVELLLEPSPADRAVVVRPQASLTILPGEDVQFFIGLPLWMRVHAVRKNARGEDTKSTLLDIPAVQLSNTWFGTPTGGELCYAAKTRARRTIAEVEDRAHRVICPLEVHNEGQFPMPLERVSVPARNLNIYQGKTKLWTDAVAVHHRLEAESTRVVIEKKAPPFDDAEALIGTARDQEQTIVRRAFGNIKSIIG